MNALQRLQFIIGLTNNISGPLHDINRSIDRTTAGIRSGFERAALGGAALAGVGYSLKKIIDPTRDMNNALGEVRSMGVAEDTLKGLSKTALEFSMQYGASAADFVRASYDIQGAISTLQGNELGVFTKASAILAKGTKADIAEITNYVGTMYGIFQTEADKMGKADWVNQLVGQSAQAIGVFKSDGHKMSEAFKGLGATATSAGVAMSEQLTVLGALQATMEGGESATKYRAFLGAIGTAQDKLNLKFTDAQGKMLGIVPILQTLKTKFGLIDTVAESDLLKKAFGTDEAVAMIKLLIPQVDNLKTNIDGIANIKGLEGAEKMAKAMIDPWSRVDAGVTALAITLGNKLVPQLMPMVDGMNAGMAALLKWDTQFPHISALVDQAILPVIGFTAASAVLYAMTGLGPLTGMWRLLVFTLKPLSFLFTAIRVGWVLMMGQMAAGAGFFTAINVGLRAMATQLWINVTAIWAWTAALLANPVTWVVVGVLALAAALTYAWLNFSSLGDMATTAMAYLVGAVMVAVNTVTGWFSGLGEWLTTYNLWGALATGFFAVVAFIRDDFSLKGIIQGIAKFIAGIDFWGAFKNGFVMAIDFVKAKAMAIFDFFGAAWAKVMAKANNIYGLGKTPAQTSSGIPDNVGKTPTNKASGIPVPGTGKQADNSNVTSIIKQSSSSSNSKTTHVTVNNNHKNPISQGQIAQSLRMAGG
jgi:TP901 family phage tail tape measure protein